ncbi:MAG: carbon starvation protein A [Tindallia sp. MSAO_Bac2]|nr:MAG: carbon starvation protein A [Tindallia sp. MSAO_Bac2]
MNALILVLISIIAFSVAYVTYGAWLTKQWGIDDSKPTPAHTRGDGVDYVPASSAVLLGHHFASIAGAGPIVGPIAAAIFGWIPVLLWIIVGSIFFGGVQDYSSLYASVRHEGKSIGEVIQSTMGRKGKRLFSIFAWLTLLLVVAAFTNIVANTFVSVPAAGTASVLFIILAIGFGNLVYRRGFSLKIGSVIGVALLLVCIALGNMFPLILSRNVWIALLLVYIAVASVTPVWILLQPRDYLNAYLLYAMLAGAVLGLLITRPTIQLEGYMGFNVGGQYLFPMLFITVACGAISGFHSLVGSGTSSKQLTKESDAKLVGYGGMLIEGVLATIAIITAAYVAGPRLTELLADGGPVNVFSDGIGVFMTSFGIPFEIGKSFVALAVSAFALTSLDTATRLGRFILQEFFEPEDPTEKKPIFTNMYAATGVTVVLGGLLAVTSWQLIWPIFGSANQLLAALALMAVAVWLKKINKGYGMFVVPIVFMFAATLLALFFLARTNLATGNMILVAFPVLLFILAIVLLVQGFGILFKTEASDQE